MHFNPSFLDYMIVNDVSVHLFEEWLEDLGLFIDWSFKATHY